MKGKSFLCSSHSSTDICFGDQQIDRYNPIILRDHRTTTNSPLSSPNPPITTASKPRNQKKFRLINLRSDQEDYSSKIKRDSLPGESSRYLLSGETTMSNLERRNPVEAAATGIKQNEQTVVMAVSLHCKGCEIKVRKHISRMPGVRSFDINFEAKKVTVMGQVSPSDVVASISKVKRAHILPQNVTSSP